MKPYINVIVVKAPITTRYCQPGSEAQLDTEMNQIRVGGVWFDYNTNEWNVVTKVKLIPEKANEEIFDIQIP